jgi:hypothetical protein
MGTPIVIPAICNPAISVNVPSVVASGIYAAQTGNLILSNIYSPSNTGIYRLSYGITSESSPVASVTGQVAYGNQSGAGVQINLNVPSSSQLIGTGSLLLYPKSGVLYPIEIDIYWTSGTYDFVYTLEAF